LVRDRLLARLFLRRFLENDLISPDADRLETLALAWAALITSSVFVTIFLSLGYLSSPFPMPRRTAVQMLRVQFLYATWSMVVMALVAVSVWDALALDSRDTSILGPLPVARGVIVRAKVLALIMFSGGFAVALNLAPGIIHPILAVTRLRPSTLTVGTLIAAHLTSTMAAGAFGFVVVLGLRELLHAILGTGWFLRISVIVQAGLVVALVTTLLLVPGFSFRVATQWLAAGAMPAYLAPPFWFVGLHDMMSGHIWDGLPRPELPARIVTAEAAFEELYRSRRPGLHQLGRTGAATFLAALLCSGAAYLWNSRRLPQPPSPRATERGRGSAIFGWIAQRLLVRRLLVRAGFFFTMRVLARSVPNRLSIGIALAVALAVGTVILRLAGGGLSWDFSAAPNALFAIQTLLVGALVTGFRHSVRVPGDLRARWLFHVVRPADGRAYLDGSKRAALVKLVCPTLMGLFPLHALVFGARTAVLHFTFGLLLALVLMEAFLLGFRKLPFASSYIPAPNMNTLGSIYACIFLAGVYAVAWLERFALSTTRGTVVLFVSCVGVLGIIRAVDVWRWRNRGAIELDELPDPATLRLGLGE
jgi:hypothetical protein